MGDYTMPYTTYACARSNAASLGYPCTSYMREMYAQSLRTILFEKMF